MTVFGHLSTWGDVILSFPIGIISLFSFCFWFVWYSQYKSAILQVRRQIPRPGYLQPAIVRRHSSKWLRFLLTRDQQGGTWCPIRADVVFCSSTFPRHVFVVHIGWLNQSEKRTPFSIHRFLTNHLQIFVFQLSSSMYMGWWHMLQVLAHLHQYGETLQSQTPLHHFVANANANGSSVWNNYIPNYNTRCLKSEPWRFCVTALFIFSILNAFVIKTSLPQKCANCRIDLWSFRLNQINI